MENIKNSRNQRLTRTFNEVEVRQLIQDSFKPHLIIFFPPTALLKNRFGSHAGVWEVRDDLVQEKDILALEPEELLPLFMKGSSSPEV